MINLRSIVGVTLLALSFFYTSVGQESIGNFNGRVFDFSIHKNQDLVLIPFDTDIILWSVSTQSILRQYSSTHRGGIRALSFSNDGNIFVSGGIDSLLVIWGVEEMEPLRVVKNLDGAILTAQFSADDKYIFASGQSKTISVINVQTGKLETSLVGHTDDVLDIEILDGEKFASTGADGKVFIWNISPFNVLTSWQAHKSWVRDIDSNEGQNYMMTVSDDGHYKKWSIKPDSLGSLLESKKMTNSWLTSVDIIDDKTYCISGHKKQVFIQTGFGNYKRKIGSIVNKSKIISIKGVYKALVATMTKGLVLIDMSE